MNATGITSNLLPLQQIAKPVESKIDQTLPNAQKNEEDPRQARAKAFYTREEEPWTKKSWLSIMPENFGEKVSMSKEKYLEHLKIFSTTELKIQQCLYSDIRNELGVFRPDLASKNFSYTLDDDATVKILDPDQSLEKNEIEYLTKLFNDRKRLGESVVNHARMAMALVDHDEETFGGKYKLDLLNIQNTLDYGKLVTLKPEQMHEAFIRQIHENGEKREEPLVDVVV